MDYEKTAGGVLLPTHKLRCVGKYSGKIVRDGKVIDEWEDENLVVNQGLNSLLDVYLRNQTQLPTWYLGLFEGNYTPLATDTAANIASNATETTAYTQANRVTWTPAAASSQSITNAASAATFTFNASKTIYGAFLVSSNTKGGTAGTLFSAARFGSSKSVVDTDQLLLTYTFSASSV